MGAVARARAFHSGWDAKGSASVNESRHIIEPRLFVKISGEKPASFILEQGINANGMSALEMGEEDPIGEP